MSICPGATGSGGHIWPGRYVWVGDPCRCGQMVIAETVYTGVGGVGSLLTFKSRRVGGWMEGVG